MRVGFFILQDFLFDCIAVDILPGMIYTAGHFDYELVREYVLNIEAKDEGDPPLSDICMVTVKITDTNDNKPTFSQSTYSANVMEDANVGDQVIRVSYSRPYLIQFITVCHIKYPNVLISFLLL